MIVSMKYDVHINLIILNADGMTVDAITKSIMLYFL